MTLRRRLGVQIAGMVFGVALLGACAVIGVRGLHQDMGLAVRANEQLRQVYAIGLHVASAKANLDDTEPHSTWRACDQLRAAVTLLGAFETQTSGSPWIAGTSAQAAALRSALHEALQSASGRSVDPAALNRCLASLADLSARTRTALTEREIAAERKHHATLLAVSFLASAAILAAIVLGVRQYRAVMRPLAQIQAAVRRIASGNLQERVTPLGDEEFTSLAGDFNQMARELNDLCEQLERRVEVKSRQLVQSERLASVGYLAAGVAHEINNPLGIIAGYGERLMRRLDRSDSAAAAGAVRETIGVMCDEAFRCKQITDRLLMLARPGDEARRSISVAAVARDVINSLRGLGRFADRQLTLDADDAALVNANEGELRQVILNLIINALDATAADGGGAVHVSVQSSGDEVELRVSDNGKGMSESTLSRIFEPFFTEKRGERPGTGLGLSVAHAIVTDHGGRIEARSYGPGCGSEFIVRLAADQIDVPQEATCQA